MDSWLPDRNLVFKMLSAKTITYSCYAHLGCQADGVDLESYIPCDVIPIPEGESTAFGTLLMHKVQKKTLIDVIALRAFGVANGVYGVKQSPRQVGDRFVAEDAPRDDTSKFLGRSGGCQSLQK